MPNSYAEWRHKVRQRDYFEPLIAAVLAQEGIKDWSGPISLFGEGSSAVFGVGDHPFLIKIVSPFDEGAFEREVQALRHLDALGRAMPRLLGCGQLGEVKYLRITRLAGRSLKEVWPSLESAGRGRVAFELGKLLRVLHGVPLAGEEAGAREKWQTFIQERRDAFFSSPGESMLPAQIYEQACRFIDEHMELAEAATPCRVHADVHGAHILIDGRGDSVQIRGLIDFGDSLFADPIYDLVVPRIQAFLGNGEAWQAFIEGYGVLPANYRERAFLYALLHRFAYLGHFGLKHWGNPDWNGLCRIYLGES